MNMIISKLPLMVRLDVKMTMKMKSRYHLVNVALLKKQLKDELAPALSLKLKMNLKQHLGNVVHAVTLMMMNWKIQSPVIVPEHVLNLNLTMKMKTPLRPAVPQGQTLMTRRKVAAASVIASRGVVVAAQT